LCNSVGDEVVGWGAHTRRSLQIIEVLRLCKDLELNEYLVKSKLAFEAIRRSRLVMIRITITRTLGPEAGDRLQGGWNGKKSGSEVP